MFNCIDVDFLQANTHLQYLRDLHTFEAWGIPSENHEKRPFRAPPGRETMHQRKNKQTALTRLCLEEGARLHRSKRKFDKIYRFLHW